MIGFVRLSLCPTPPFSGSGVFRRDPLEWLVGPSYRFDHRSAIHLRINPSYQPRNGSEYFKYVSSTVFFRMNGRATSRNGNCSSSEKDTINVPMPTMLVNALSFASPEAKEHPPSQHHQNVCIAIKNAKAKAGNTVQTAAMAPNTCAFTL
jgi:hypothetical protein